MGSQISSEAAPIVEISSLKPSMEGLKGIVTEPGNLVNFSTEVNEFRRTHRRWFAIHTYLPSLLIEHAHDDVLRLMGMWRKSIAENETLEFYLLPVGVFQEFEHKLGAIVDGVIQIGSYGETRRFTPIRCTRFHDMRSFDYVIVNNRLLIKWGDEFLDRLPLSTETLEKHIDYVLENLDYLTLDYGETPIGEETSVRDRLILSQIARLPLSTVLTIFYDRRKELLTRIAEWYIKGNITLVKSQPVAKPEVKSNLGLLTKLILRLPVNLSSKILSATGLLGKTVPVEGLLVRSKVDRSFVSVLFPRGLPPSLIDLENIEQFLQNVASRLVTFQVIRKLGEDPRNRIDIAYVPKIVTLLLRVGYSAKATVRKVAEDSYEVSVRDCPICKEEKSSEPVCISLCGSLEGNVTMCFKRKATCVETRCRATGDAMCTFFLEFPETVEIDNKTTLDKQTLHAALSARRA